MKKVLNMIFCLFFIFLVFGPVRGEKIKFKTIDGVQVIYNPKKPAPPKGALTKLILKEDFSLGEDEEEMFSEITSYAVDDEENIYIVDRKESRIKIFSRLGKFVKAVGNKGQGPGEMNQPVGIQITPDNELMVEDAANRRLAFFALDGKFLKNLSPSKILSLINIYFDSKGNMVGRELALSENQLTWHVKKYDSDLNPLFTIDSIPFPNLVQGKINPFLIIFSYQLDKKDCIYYGIPKEYEIKIFNPEGKLIKRILKDYNRVKITEEDKEEILENIPDTGVGLKDRIEFPKFFPAYQQFSIDEQGRLIVITYEKGKNKGEYLGDVFDNEGRYIAKIPLKIRPGMTSMIWKKGKLYLTDESEDGYNILRRYSVYWEK